ncbi:hypothetical protein F5887DRAFT_952913, partial [Amanita rubescens]
PLRRCLLFATIPIVLFFTLRGVWRVRFRSRSGRCDLFLVPLSRGALVFGGTKHQGFRNFCAYMHSSLSYRKAAGAGGQKSKSRSVSIGV